MNPAPIVLLALVAGCSEQRLHELPEPPGFDDTAVGTTPDDTGGETGDLPLPDIDVDPHTIAFASHRVGESDFAELTIANLGDAPLEVTAIEWRLSDGGPFRLALPDGWAVPFQLEPGRTLPAWVWYEPTDAASQLEVLLVESDDPDEVTSRVSVSADACTPTTGWEDALVAVPEEAGVEMLPLSADGVLDAGAGVEVTEAVEGLHVLREDGALVVAGRGVDSGAHHRFDWDDCVGRWVASTFAADLPYAPRGASDLDGDGDLDLYGWNADGTGYVSLASGGGFDHRSDALTLPEPGSSTVRLVAPHAGDLDGDGILDLLVGELDGTDATTLRLYRHAGLGDGTFASRRYLGSLALGASALDLGDVDGDGHVDLLVGLDDDGDPGQVWLLRGSASGFGAPERAFDVAPTWESWKDGPGEGRLSLYDADGDGDLDAVVAFTADFESVHALGVARNAGDGTFDPPGDTVGVSGPELAVPPR